MINYESDYLSLCQSVCALGETRASRVGNTHQLFGTMLRISSLMYNRFPILTTRKMHPRGVFGELAAFLKGATELSEFQAEGCNYWDDNAHKWTGNLGRTKDKYKVGRIYGAQWRNWEGDDEFQGLDQIYELVKGIKTNPTSRRHLLTTYNPGELQLGCLPPCHLLAQFNVRAPFLDCMVTMRSVDLCLGLPSDVVLYAALLLLVAKDTGYVAGELTFSMGDTHVYANHRDMLYDQQLREPGLEPKFVLDPDASLDNFSADDITLINYNPQPAIKYALNT